MSCQYKSLFNSVLTIFFAGKNQYNEQYLTIGLRKKPENENACTNAGCAGDWVTYDSQGNTQPLINYELVPGAVDGFQQHGGGDCAYSLYVHSSGWLVIRSTPCATPWSYPLCQRVP